MRGAEFGHLLIMFEMQHTEKSNCITKLLAVFIEEKISVRLKNVYIFHLASYVQSIFQIKIRKLNEF